MKILLMGVGYVGMPLLISLQDRGYEVYVTTTQALRVDSLKKHTKNVLLLKPEDHDEGLAHYMDLCDAMIVMVAPDSTHDYRSTYLQTAQRITKQLEGRKKPFSLIYTSSTSVYEGIEAAWATEELALVPSSEKASLLLETEKTFGSWGNSCILRLGGIFGPGREICRRAKYFSGKEIAGSGQEPTNHIHVDDIIAAIIFSLEKVLVGVYNLVCDDHPTRKELYDHLCKDLGLPLPLWNPDLPILRGGYRVSNHKITEAGFSLTRSLARL